MCRLIAGRYLADGPSSAWDLATGARSSADDGGRAAPEGPPLGSLIEVLDHGQEGSPRCLTMRIGASDPRAVIERVAADAQARGFVPVALHVYMRHRAELDDALRDRALLLIAASGDRGAGWDALLDAAARSPRPHLLLRLEESRRKAIVAREARLVYGAVPAARPQPLDAEAERQLRRAARAGEFLAEGRHAAAERLLREVAAALMRRRHPGAAAGLLVQLGRALLDRGRALDGERAFEQAALAAAGIDRSAMVEARIWQAAARIDADRLAEAEALCRALLTGDEIAPDARARAEATLARALLWQGRTSEAAAMAERLEHSLSAAPPCPYAAATLVRLLVADQRLFDAGVQADRLLGATRDADAGRRVIAQTAYLRVLVAAGDLGAADDVVRQVAVLAQEVRAPLRAGRARLVWAEGLLRAGRAADARREIDRLLRLSRAAPALFRRAVQQLLRKADAPGRAPARVVAFASHAPAAVRLVRAAHEQDDDEAAVRAALQVAAEMARATRIDATSAGAGPVTTILGVGSGLATRLGARVLDLGLALGPEPVESGREAGVPVRRGIETFGALVARWPADREPPPGAVDLLELAAAVIGPRLEGLLAGRRVAAAASAAVPELVGVSGAMADVRTAIARAAAAPFAVLIQGESGVGKELVARAIHQLSARRERRFCDLNCAALPEELLESELFGHARGAFTGAVAERAGVFEAADGGTLFLDEIADLSLRAQAKLLRAVQQQEVRRLGETFARTVDVRLVAAANRDLALEAESGRFRQDLLYRLDVIRMRIPPLRERPEDVAPLVQHVWPSAAARVGTAARLSHGVIAALSRYHWPGNVRELQNVVSALAVAAPARGIVRAHLLPPAITGAASVASTRLSDARAQFERRVIESALARAGGSRSRAARELGLSRQGLLKMVARLGIDRTRHGPDGGRQK